MKIDKLSASFGCLENESLSFHDGLNVVCAPNESGKSTWCAFIQAMLYGIDSSQRSRSGFLPDKQRYAPWSGAPMQGSMDLTKNGMDITITRSTRQKNAPMREFSATYTGTNTPVEGLTGTNSGELLTGVGKEVFRRSAFVAQGQIAVSGSPELEKRIASIVSTGEESSSYSEAEQRLRQWQRKRRYNRRGLLPELEERMDDSRRRLEQLHCSQQDMEQLEQRLEKDLKDCGELEARVTDSRKRQRREALDRLRKGRAIAEQRSQEHDEALEALDESRQALRSCRLGLWEQDELEQESSADIKALGRLGAVEKQKLNILPALILFLIAAAFAAVFSYTDAVIAILAAAGACLGSIMLFFRYSKERQKLHDAQEQRRKILKKYKANSVKDIMESLHEYRGLALRLEEAEKQERLSRIAYDTAREQQRRLEEQAMEELDLSGGDSEAARLGKDLSIARASCQNLSQQLAQMNGRLGALGDPLVLSSDLSAMEEEHRLLEEEQQAISLALEVLEEADKQMQSRFSPELGRLAGKYMSAVTDGRYDKILLGRDFSARTQAPGEAVSREAEYLSAGATDLMYLAVRLAVCQLALPAGENCPLIIDDALVNLDEKRMAQAMELLRQIARDRQVILFTCRDPFKEGTHD